MWRSDINEEFTYCTSKQSVRLLDNSENAALSRLWIVSWVISLLRVWYHFSHQHGSLEVSALRFICLWCPPALCVINGLAQAVFIREPGPVWRMELEGEIQFSCEFKGIYFPCHKMVILSLQMLPRIFHKRKWPIIKYGNFIFSLSLFSKC